MTVSNSESASERDLPFHLRGNYKPVDDEVTALDLAETRDIAAEPVAVVHLPQRVPFGFHGSWFTDE